MDSEACLMDSKYPVGTPQSVINACEELYEEAEARMADSSLPADLCRGFFLATLRLKLALEREADLAAAELDENRKKAVALLREKLEKEGVSGQPA
jgi:hypothetical protein